MWSMQILQCTSILSIKDKLQTLRYPHSIKNVTEKKKICLQNNIYCGRDRITLTDELDLCDDGNITSNKDKLLKIGNLLGVESKTCNDILNQG